MATDIENDSVAKRMEHVSKWLSASHSFQIEEKVIENKI